MRVTQKDIAKRLNLSQSLVAGVLNDRPGVWASEETRQRVQQTARELNYQPNAAARALRRGKTNVVACVFFGQPGHSAVIEKLADSLADTGYDLLVKVILNPVRDMSRFESLFSAGTCDAVALWGLEHHVEEPARRLQRENIPFVVKGRLEEEHPDWYQIDFDHEGMMAQAVKHLASRGHERIAFIGYSNGPVFAQKQERGFRLAMQALLGQPVSEAWIGTVDNTPRQVERQMAFWMALPEAERPTAAVVGTGHIAWEGIERFLARSGRRIGDEPGDFAVSGQGGMDLPLVFGEALAYRNTDLADLAEAMTRQLLLPILEDKRPKASIVRLLPTLHPCATLRFPIPCGETGK